MSNLLVKIDPFLGRLETTLNRCGWIPIVNFISAPLRMLVGKIEVIVSLFLAFFSFLQAAVKQDRYLLLRTQHILSYSLHGLSNMVRAAVEIVPFSFYLTLLHDTYIGRFNYQYETLGRGIYPLAYHPYQIA